jgi:PAS domain-containing protein
VTRRLQQSGKNRVESGDLPSTGESLISHFQLLEAILEGTPDPIFAKDAEGRFILVNSACAGVFGRPRSEVYGRRISELMNSGSARQI